MRARIALAGTLAVACALVALGGAMASASGPELRGAFPNDLIYEDFTAGFQDTSDPTTECELQNDHRFIAGGGIQLPFSYRPAKLISDGPVPGAWRLFVANKGDGNPASYNGYTICSFFPTKFRSARFAVPDDGKAHSRTVSCPSGAKALSGGVLGYSEENQKRSRSILESYPVDGPDKGKGRGDAWRVTVRDTQKSPIRATANVVCNKAPGIKVGYRHDDFDLRSKKFAGLFVDCQDPEQVTGGGPQLSNPKAGARLTTSSPFDTPADEDSNPSDRWATGMDGADHGKIEVEAWAVCATYGGGA